MAKKVFKGWIPKYNVNKILVFFDGFLELRCNVCQFKGKKEYYLEEEWPPKKVTITVEVEE